VIKEFDFDTAIPVLFMDNFNEFLLRGYFIRMLVLRIDNRELDLLMKVIWDMSDSISEKSGLSY